MLALLAVLVLLPLLTYASPPDPSWVDGYWDDDDFDNVVVLILTTYAVAVIPLPVAGPVRTHVAVQEPPDVPTPAPPPCALAQQRAPPLVVSPL
jgi:hypothetical protein